LAGSAIPNVSNCRHFLDGKDAQDVEDDDELAADLAPVSYTHLTLPTN
jgi:hypothetical protein